MSGRTPLKLSLVDDLGVPTDCMGYNRNRMSNTSSESVLSMEEDALDICGDASLIIDELRFFGGSYSISTTLTDQIWKGASDNTTSFSLFPTIYTPESGYSTGSNPLAK